MGIYRQLLVGLVDMFPLSEEVMTILYSLKLAEGTLNAKSTID